MAFKQDISPEDDFFIGDDFSMTFFVVTGRPIKVRLEAEDGDTTIDVEALKSALTSGDKLRFGEAVITLGANADVGDTQLTVSALSGNVPRGATLYLIVDITDWTATWYMKESAGDSADILSKSASISSAANGIFTVAVADTDTDSLTAKRYYHRLKRTNAGSEKTLVYGDAYLRRAA